jgi:hypothetical protein
MIPGKVPVQGNNYSNRPYGDGQTNALATFGQFWNQKRPPLVVILAILKTGGSALKFKFHGSLVFTEPSVEVAYLKNGTPHFKKFGILSKNSDGDYEAVWQPNNDEAPIWGSMFQNNVAFVRLGGWNDWFPVDFRNVVIPNQQLLNQVPPSLRVLGKGSLLDPERVSVQGQATSAFPFQKMGDPLFGSDIEATKYFPVQPPGIHNSYYTDDGKVITTAVNNGATVVIPSRSMNPPGIAPFKMAYICFEPRNERAESVAGVPSGGGWHEIGDPAETVINSLENAPVVFGYANGQTSANPPSGNFAYGLTDVAVIRKIFPGTAIVTSAGPTTLQEGYSPNRGRGPAEGRNYHWFIFNHTSPVCAMEWVHNCVPNPGNNLGLGCQ